jgi:hypothetical protein
MSVRQLTVVLVISWRWQSVCVERWREIQNNRPYQQKANHGCSYASKNGVRTDWKPFGQHRSCVAPINTHKLLICARLLYPALRSGDGADLEWRNVHRGLTGCWKVVFSWLRVASFARTGEFYHVHLWKEIPYIHLSGRWRSREILNEEMARNLDFVLYDLSNYDASTDNVKFDSFMGKKRNVSWHRKLFSLSPWWYAVCGAEWDAHEDETPVVRSSHRTKQPDAMSLCKD